jgi:hypothetical protein
MNEIICPHCHKAFKVSFSDPSPEIFRQDFIKGLNQRQKYDDAMPLGVYTGFKALKETAPATLDDLLSGIQGGDLAANAATAAANTLEAQYSPENCDLILWFVVSPQNAPSGEAANP